jgi:DNA gyrase/topoisomerase IV subunit B
VSARPDLGQVQARIGAGLVAAVHVGLYDPKFGGPTKAHLTNREACHAVELLVAEHFRDWLRTHRELASRLSKRLRDA